MAKKPFFSKGKKQAGPYPMEKLKRVDKPTTKITDNVQRPDEREHGFARARRGDFGAVPQQDIARFIPKYPLGRALAKISMAMAGMNDGEIAPIKAPIPEDPKLLSEHIKKLGYFLRADIVGICRLPQYAVYSHDMTGTAVECSHKNAIVLVVDQDYNTMAGSTGDDWISGSQSFIGYSNAALIPTSWPTTSGRWDTRHGHKTSPATRCWWCHY